MDYVLNLDLQTNWFLIDSSSSYSFSHSVVANLSTVDQSDHNLFKQARNCNAKGDGFIWRTPDFIFIEEVIPIYKYGFGHSYPYIQKLSSPYMNGDNYQLFRNQTDVQLIRLPVPVPDGDTFAAKYTSSKCPHCNGIQKMGDVFEGTYPCPLCPYPFDQTEPGLKLNYVYT